jgi:3-oxoacyl-[acyl-carrier-protein] synthase II
MQALQATPGGGAAIPGRRVAITGIGVVAPCGIGREAFWAGLLGPAPDGFRRIVDLDTSAIYGPKEIRRVDRFTQFAAVAAAEAIGDAGGLEALNSDPDRAGVMIGTGIGGLQTLEDQDHLLVEKGARRVSPFLVPMMMGNRAAADVSMRYGLRGPCEATVTACAAGTHSIGNGARLIATGRCDVVLAGSAEAAITDLGVAGFGNMTALSNKGVSMPFDAHRDGFVIGEGGAVLVLEELGRAQARGAYIYAEIAGAANTADAHHITAPAPDGAGAVM